MFTDSHCHIFKSDYNDIDEVLNEAKQNHIEKIINNATDLKSMQELLELVEIYPNMYGALGIHPESVKEYKDEDLVFLKEDYHYTKENKEKQIKLFEKQLQIAQDENMPVIIHNREATNDILKSLKKFRVRGVIHCFNGSYETALEYLKLGFKLGINGVVTFKNCKLKDVLKKLSINDLVLETDSPYLTPTPNRGKQNAPKYIKDIAKFIAQIHQISQSQVEIITNKNIRQIFDI